MTMARRTVLIGAAAACVPAGVAWAQNAPIPGIDVIVKKQPAGTAIGRATTDANGRFVVNNLAPGSYEIELEGKSLVTANARARAGAGPARSAIPGVPAIPGGARPTGDRPVAGDVSGDGVSILIGLLLPAVQKAREAGATNQQRHTAKAAPGGVRIALTVPDRVGGVASPMGFTLEGVVRTA